MGRVQRGAIRPDRISYIWSICRCRHIWIFSSPELNWRRSVSCRICRSDNFSIYEMRIPSPVLDITLLTKNRVFAMSNFSALINYSATFAVTFLLSLDLQYTKGFSPEHAGFILVVQPIVMALVSPIAGGSRTGLSRVSLHLQVWLSLQLGSSF